MLVHFSFKYIFSYIFLQFISFFVWHCPVLLYIGQYGLVFSISELVKNSNTNTMPSSIVLQYNKAGIVHPCLSLAFAASPRWGEF